MDRRIGLIAGLTCLIASAHCQSISTDSGDYRPLKGSKELGIASNWISVNGHTFNSFSGDFGYYLTPNLVGVASVSFDRSTGSQEALFFIGGRYEFISSGKIVPYLRAGLYRRTGNNAVTTDKAGVGANFYLRQGTAIFAELGFYRFGHQTRDTTTSLDVGIRIFFK